MNVSTFESVDAAIDDLERAALHYANARSMDDFPSWPAPIRDRIDLLRRASANLRAEMIREMSNSTQEELKFDAD